MLKIIKIDLEIFFFFDTRPTRYIIGSNEKLGQIPKQCGFLAQCPEYAYFNLLYLSYVTPVFVKDSGTSYITVTLL